MAELRHRWRAGDEDAGERLILAYLPLVRAVAARLAAPCCEREDLVQAGLLSLVRALRRFRPEVGVDLATFAFPFVGGDQGADERRERRRPEPPPVAGPGAGPPRGGQAAPGTGA